MCKYMVVKSERKRQNGSGAVVRGGSAEARAVRNGPMSVTCLPPRTRVTSGPGMLPTAISGSATLRFLLTSMTSVATKATGMSRVWVTTCGHRGVHELFATGAMLLSGLGCHSGKMMTSGLGYCWGLRLGLCPCKKPGLRPKVSVTTKGLADDRVQVKHLSPWWSLRAILPLDPSEPGCPVLLPRVMMTSKPWSQTRSYLPQPGWV